MRPNPEKELHEKLSALQKQEAELLARIKLVNAAAQEELLGAKQARANFNEHYYKFNLPKATFESKKTVNSEQLRENPKKPPKVIHRQLDGLFQQRNTSAPQQKRNADFLKELTESLTKVQKEIQDAQAALKAVQHAHARNRTVQPDVAKLISEKNKRALFFSAKETVVQTPEATPASALKS